jgi:hypothetical protein
MSPGSAQRLETTTEAAIDKSWKPGDIEKIR